MGWTSNRADCNASKTRGQVRRDGRLAGRPTMGHATRMDAVFELHQKGHGPAEMVAIIGGTARSNACLLRYAKRRRGIIDPRRAVLTPAAKERGISVQELESRLLDIIAKERLVDAIMDDRAEAAE